MKRYKLFLCICIIAALVFASNFGGRIAYGLLYLSVLIPVFSFLYTLYVYSKFRIYQLIDRKTIVKGELVPYKYTIANEDYITFRSLQIKFFQDKSKVVGANEVEEYCLLPGEKKTNQTSLRCNYRGEYEVGVNAIVITDFLRLLEITYPLRSKYKVIVLPRVINLTKLRILPIEQDSKRTRYLNHTKDAEIDSELRRYVNGDHRKLIHWKASAKKNELLTRKLTQNPRREIMLYVDLSKVKVQGMDTVVIEDQVIEAALAISNYCLKSYIPLEIHYESNVTIHKKIRSSIDFENFYQECAKIHFHAEKGLSDMITERSYGNGLYMILSHNLDEALCLTLQKLIQRGLEVVLLYITCEMSEESTLMLATLRGMGVTVREILGDDNLEDIL
jgi:uncharacterized protein (DUF58 family)